MCNFHLFPKGLNFDFVFILKVNRAFVAVITERHFNPFFFFFFNRLINRLKRHYNTSVKFCSEKKFGVRLRVEFGEKRNFHFALVSNHNFFKKVTWVLYQ